MSELDQIVGDIELRVVLKNLGVTEAQFWAMCDAKVREIRGRRKCTQCAVSLNDDDRRWCGKGTRICRECKFEDHGDFARG